MALAAEPDTLALFLTEEAGMFETKRRFTYSTTAETCGAGDILAATLRALAAHGGLRIASAMVKPVKVDVQTIDGRIWR